MKGNSLVVGMAFLLAAISLIVAWYAFQFVQLTRGLNKAQFTLTQVELRQNRLKALVNESAEYAQHNPSILPLLQSIGARPPTAAPTEPRTVRPGQ